MRLDHLKYWEEKGIIAAYTDSPSQISSSAGPIPAAPEKSSVSSVDTVPTKVHIAPTGQKITSNAHQRLTAADINRMAQKDSNIPLLLQETQLLLGRELTPGQTGLLMDLYTDYNLSPQYIFTLVSYCASIGKGNMNYIGSVAAGWLEQGITSVEQAENQIAHLETLRSRENQVKTAFGIHDRALTANQKNYINRWFDQYGMDLDMIRLAYDQTVDTIGKISFPYMDKIMLNWKQQGLSTPEAVSSANATRKNTLQESKRPSYDMDLINQRFELGKIK